MLLIMPLSAASASWAGAFGAIFAARSTVLQALRPLARTCLPTERTEWRARGVRKQRSWASAVFRHNYMLLIRRNNWTCTECTDTGNKSFFYLKTRSSLTSHREHHQWTLEGSSGQSFMGKESGLILRNIRMHYAEKRRFFLFYMRW